jgi:hypothetical protein
MAFYLLRGSSLAAVFDSGCRQLEVGRRSEKIDNPIQEFAVPRDRLLRDPLSVRISAEMIPRTPPESILSIFFIQRPSDLIYDEKIVFRLS